MGSVGVKHIPTDKSRQQVEMLSGYGVPQLDISIIMDMDDVTLRKHYRKELDLGKAKANAKIGQTLFQQAVAGNFKAAQFWARCQMGWKEKSSIEITGADGAPLSVQVINYAGIKASDLQPPEEQE